MKASGPQQETIRPGQVVAQGRYVLLEELGRGGLATVFRARDTGDGSELALKVLCDRYMGRPEREERLRRELDYAARVDHPAVIRVEELGVLEDGRPFFSMELVAGRPLSSIISGSGGLPFSRTRRLARAIAVALDAVHSAGIVHRDIKPANVLVLADDRIKLIDFGMAGDGDAPAVPAGHTSRLTRANDLLGTHEYMAPEQVLRAPPRRAMDVFALGVVMYEMLSSITPYSGMKVREYVELQIAGDPCVRSAQRWARIKGAPVAFAELVDDCRRREPGERPDMQEVIRRLDALEGATAISRVSAPGMLALTTDLQPPGMVAVGSERTKRAGWSSVGWIGGSATVLVVVSGWLLMAGPVVIDAAEASEVDEASGLEGREASVGADAMVLREAMQRSASSSSPAERSDSAGDGIAEDARGSHEVAVRQKRPTPPRAARRREASPRTRPPVPQAMPTPADAVPSEVECEHAIDAARAALETYRWEAVLAHTSEPACWSNRKAEHVAMRTEAFMEEAQWAECVHMGRRSADPRVRRFAERCQKRLDTITDDP